MSGLGLLVARSGRQRLDGGLAMVWQGPIEVYLSSDYGSVVVQQWSSDGSALVLLWSGGASDGPRWSDDGLTVGFDNGPTVD